jgi:hypothetical protein
VKQTQGFKYFTLEVHSQKNVKCDRMKSLNAKRIAAVAATLLMGMAVGAQGVSYANVPLVNSQGQPVVQIVVGGTAQPSDGVVAANIAAVIGNLALTTQNISATVNGQSGVKCVLTSTTGASCPLTMEQVWVGEKGLSAPSGSYAFSALIGSVLNRAVSLNSPGNTKTLQSSSSQYAFPDSGPTSVGQLITTTPQASPYSLIGYVPTQVLPSSTTTGGGVSFNSFSDPTTPPSDNVYEITPTQLPGLTSNWGGVGETGYLWLTGFPVFDQQSGVNQFVDADAGGAYQVVFGHPIQKETSGGSNSLSVPIRLLGQNWTVLNETPPTTPASVLPTNIITGTSQITLAQALTPQEIVYVGHNVTNSSVGGFQVQLTDLGNQNTAGQAVASFNVYYNGVLTPNTVAISPYNTLQINFSGHILYIRVNQTFAGLYAYQKYAKVQLLSNVYVVTNGAKFNNTYDPGWYDSLWWTNTSSSGGKPWALESIVIYNYTPTQQLEAGQSFNFIEQPARWSVKFLGDNLGNNYDSITAKTAYVAPFLYQNVAPAVNSMLATNGLSIANVTEPAEELQVSSGVSGAFATPGGSSSTVNYTLTPYELVESHFNTITFNQGLAQNAILVFTENGVNDASWISAGGTNLNVQIMGYNGASQVNQQVTFTSNSQVQPLTQAMSNVTAIKLSRPLPGNVVIAVYSGSNTLNAFGTAGFAANTFATLQTTGPAILYGEGNNNGPQYYLQQNSSGPTYLDLQYNTGQPSNFRLTSLEGVAFQTAPVPDTSGAVGAFFQYSMGEVAVSTNTAATDSLQFTIFNSTSGTQAAGTNFFQLNYSLVGGTVSHNNITYNPSSQAAGFRVAPGFRTERGSEFVGYANGGTQANIDMAKAYDTLEFLVGPASSTNTTSTTTTYGPYTIGQSIANYPNITIANVSAQCSFVASGCNVTGLGNLTATPSVQKAVVWPNGKPYNFATNPIAVLDSQASNSPNQIVIGSAFVNSVAKQIFNNNPTFATGFDQGGATGQENVTVQAFGNKILVAGYTANQTVQAGNKFINQLLNQVSST